MSRLKAFIALHQKVVIKPLDGMGGASIFLTHHQDPNRSVILETLTRHGQCKVMAQRYIPEICEGDKRILMIDGHPVPYALARIPAPGEGRANLAAGGKGQGIELTERDRWICSQVSQDLQQAGLFLVGLDVIGDYLTEINVTSPTCMRELDRQYGLNLAGDFFDALIRRWETL
jgi:glutathione synthase